MILETIFEDCTRVLEILRNLFDRSFSSCLVAAVMSSLPCVSKSIAAKTRLSFINSPTGCCGSVLSSHAATSASERKTAIAAGRRYTQ